jgi:hypothetical protein
LDPTEYNTRTHQSNMDVHDCVQPGDLMQGAAIMATFVYHTIMREQMMQPIPMRKPLPKEKQPPNSTSKNDRENVLLWGECLWPDSYPHFNLLSIRTD